ncbi:MAG: 16S rRNA (guanine(527)-N(7))-methyltransferase RsmG [Gammaproteobacteria bacterium]|nr:16S rRNA (guanine(527)-N(7))-methyltransferase RsmG [Gammaproteobacteria bacterium]
MPHKEKISLENLLQSGVTSLNLHLTTHAQEKIISYLKLLAKWNKTYNLTAITNLHDMLILHVFDSLSIAPYIIGPNILDIGTGAGFPGIPLALVFPEWHFVLLDSNRKKTTFIQHAILTLGIKNVTVVQNRIEQFQFASGFVTIVTRATTKIKVLIALTKHLGNENSQLLIMKGKYPEHELSEVHGAKVVKLHVPELQAERHLVIVNLKDIL